MALSSHLSDGNLKDPMERLDSRIPNSVNGYSSEIAKRSAGCTVSSAPVTVTILMNFMLTFLLLSKLNTISANLIF